MSDKRVINVVVGYTDNCAKFLRIINSNAAKIKASGRKVKITVMPDITSPSAINKLNGMGIGVLPAVLMQNQAPVTGLKAALALLLSTAPSDIAEPYMDDTSLMESYNNDVLRSMRSGVSCRRGKNGTQLHVEDDDEEAGGEGLNMEDILRRHKEMRRKHHGGQPDEEDEETAPPARQRGRGYNGGFDNGHDERRRGSDNGRGGDAEDDDPPQRTRRAAIDPDEELREEMMRVVTH